MAEAMLLGKTMLGVKGAMLVKPCSFSGVFPRCVEVGKGLCCEGEFTHAGGCTLIFLNAFACKESVASDGVSLRLIP